jgi:hypothetical protein
MDGWFLFFGFVLKGGGGVGGFGRRGN